MTVDYNLRFVIINPSFLFFYIYGEDDVIRVKINLTTSLSNFINLFYFLQSGLLYRVATKHLLRSLLMTPQQEVSILYE